MRSVAQCSYFCCSPLISDLFSSRQSVCSVANDIDIFKETTFTSTISGHITVTTVLEQKYNLKKKYTLNITCTVPASKSQICIFYNVYPRWKSNIQLSLGNGQNWKNFFTILWAFISIYNKYPSMSFLCFRWPLFPMGVLKLRS